MGYFHELLPLFCVLEMHSTYDTIQNMAEAMKGGNLWSRQP